MDEIAERRVLHFAGVILDGVRGCLRGPDGAEVPLAPKPFNLLMVLACNAGRTMSKDALLDAIWPSVHVSEDSLFQAVREARRAIGDEAGRVLRSVPRRGYLLDAVASTEALPSVTMAPSVTAAASMLASPADKPSLVVLPFHNMSADPEQEYFADGVVEDITTALSRLRWLFVIARNSAFTYKGRAVDVRQVGRDLGVRYVLEGSVRRAGGQVRIGCQLIEAESGHNVWADRFEGEFADVFALQDRVMEAVAGAVLPRLETAELERSRRKHPESLDAWDLVLRALPLIHGMTLAGHEQALDLLARAIVLDPNYATALGLAAWCHTLRLAQLWSPKPDDSGEGRDLARRAIAVGADDPEALTMGGYALGFLNRDPHAGLPAIDRGLTLNPNSARGYTFSGWLRSFAGDHARAIEHFARAVQLSPMDPMAYRTRGGAAFSHLFSGMPDEAAAMARQALMQQANFAPAHRALIAALGHLGRFDEAVVAIHHACSVSPGLTTTSALAVARFVRPEDRTVFRDGLLLAGLPE